MVRSWNLSPGPVNYHDYLHPVNEGVLALGPSYRLIVHIFIELREFYNF